MKKGINTDETPLTVYISWTRHHYRAGLTHRYILDRELLSM